jgi:hypothetical protein
MRRVRIDNRFFGKSLLRPFDYGTKDDALHRAAGNASDEAVANYHSIKYPKALAAIRRHFKKTDTPSSRTNRLRTSLHRNRHALPEIVSGATHFNKKVGRILKTTILKRR